mmetsp:Transcript_75547/g.157590  ORF Transcript_75547/g.157590 Transcript_75547/m.157590 type:complete len:856 (+) Transcript_75547:106-2673(+)
MAKGKAKASEGAAPQLSLWARWNPFRMAVYFVMGLVKMVLLGVFCLKAYRIRMHAINTFGHVIHEFDPWFNYRATVYLADHGWEKFFKWYDYMSWYPIGRPVGTTIYPGMQIVSVWIWEALKFVPEKKLSMPKEILSEIPKWVLAYFPNKGKYLAVGPMSLNDVCCLVPAWFGALATFLVFLLASELSESTSVGLAAAAIMSIIPAHIMRSVGGGFDNEAVAVSAFCLTLWLWVRCVRTPKSWPIGVLAGLAYVGAAATWGGYIFINNLIALHACILVVLGKYNTGLYRAFTLYYIIGTWGAMRVPVIGWAPLRSLEQMPSVLVFGTYQIIEFCEIVRRRYGGEKFTPWKYFGFRVAVFTTIGLVAGAVAWVLMEMGVFMPLGARIRGLFLEAVKTGNPLVDSVAEHSPANERAYELYLGKPRFLAVFGLLFCWHQRTPGKFLIFLYAAVAFHYSLKMSRLMIICGPVVSVLAGFPVGLIFDWCLNQFIGLVSPRLPAEPYVPLPPRSGGMGSIYRTIWHYFGGMIYPQEVKDLCKAKDSLGSTLWFVDRPVRAIVAWAILVAAWNRFLPDSKEFIAHCEEVAVHMSSPQLMFETTLRDGRKVIVDDYIRGYEWIRDNTPEDSRVMAWWDYGYQITGVANRTSIADGNTWNHEHIATLGRILTGPEKRCHNAMRHLADYVLVWAGGHGDDMGKSPHLARIGNSVFPDHCGDDDPLCQKFGFYEGGQPTPMMARSFLYKAVNHNLKEGVRLNPKYWKEVHTTKYGLMRVFQVMNVSQESKEWIADPANRLCDAPGSWYCVGQYPPALQPMIEKRKNFPQLEDFNRKGKFETSAYSKYIESQRSGGGKKSSSSDDEL